MGVYDATADSSRSNQTRVHGEAEIFEGDKQYQNQHYPERAEIDTLYK